MSTASRVGRRVVAGASSERRWQTRWRGVGACLVGGLLAGLAVTAGCGANGKVENANGASRKVRVDEPLLAQARSPVADLPVPVGFSLHDSPSEALSIGTGRYVSHYYRGPTDKNRVARFYRDQLVANHQWQLDFIRNAKGVWRLHFAKGGERCSVTISENWLGRTTIHAEIYPIIPPG